MKKETWQNLINRLEEGLQMHGLQANITIKTLRDGPDELDPLSLQINFPAPSLIEEENLAV